MFTGFNLDLTSPKYSSYVNAGKAHHDANKQQVQSKLRSFKDGEGNLLASEIVANWFPPIKADVFLSHSHRDSEQIIGLSGWLHQEFGLTTFIDSCVWGFSEKLLKQIDDEYCLNSNGKTYSYDKRNRSTSHVYMMLSTALTKMINSCECIIFANTPNSISPKNYIQKEETTDSPWIYSEIAMTSLIQKRTLDDHRGVTIAEDSKMFFQKSLEEASLNVTYDVDLNHLTLLSESDLARWKLNSGSRKGTESLDTLYKLKGINRG